MVWCMPFGLIADDPIVQDYVIIIRYTTIVDIAQCWHRSETAWDARSRETQYGTSDGLESVLITAIMFHISIPYLYIVYVSFLI